MSQNGADLKVLYDKAVITFLFRIQMNISFIFQLC